MRSSPHTSCILVLLIFAFNHSIAQRSRKKETGLQASAPSEEPCNECKKSIRHRAPVTCPKALWENDFQSTIPRKGKEGRSEAARRVWPSVRHHFAVDQKYFRLADWTYKGPLLINKKALCILGIYYNFYEDKTR